MQDAPREWLQESAESVWPTRVCSRSIFDDMYSYTESIKRGPLPLGGVGRSPDSCCPQLPAVSCLWCDKEKTCGTRMSHSQRRVA